MTKIEKATIHPFGNSRMILLPLKLRKDKDYPFKKEDEEALAIEITKDCKGRKGLFIRRL